MLPELTKLVKITAVHCEHLSTHLVTGDGQLDALVTPGYQLSVMMMMMMMKRLLITNSSLLEHLEENQGENQVTATVNLDLRP